MIQIKNFIDGEFCDAKSKKTIESINPAKNLCIASLPDSSSDDVDAAVLAAEKAFVRWSKTDAKKRANILYQIADLIEENLDDLAYCESIDQGKPLWLAKEVDIPRAAENFRFFAGAILHESSDFYKSSDDVYNYSLRQAFGVAGLISPWNLPLYLLTWKIAPAIACGNTCIAKPSEMTPLTAFKLSELLQVSDLENGVVNIIHGYGHSVGDAITSHPKIPLISFTGGTETGKKVYHNAVKGFKKVSLELGGKNPSIIFADADYEKVLNTTVHSAFRNQGEICLCGSRIYVEEELYDRFLSDFVEKVKNLKVGDPLDESSNLGAIVSEAHYKKVLSYIDLAKEEGGRIECGGRAAEQLNDENKDGFFIEPTVITGLKPSCRVINEEIFGPVVTISSFKSDADVIKLANGTSYGLAANIWTKNLKRAHRLSAEIDSGIIWVNTWMNRDLRTAFGGMRHSGVGREGGRYSLEFFTKVKNVCIDLENS